jgi:hypothetical protein
MIRKALGFAVARGYVTKETVSQFIAKAGREEIALSNFLNKPASPAEVAPETKPAETQTSQTKTAGQPAVSS